MFSGRWELKPEEDGSYFIDRDPTVFRHVLNLRGQPPSLNLLSTQELQQLKEDAEFYQLPKLSEYLRTSFRFMPGPNYKVSSDGLEITKTSTTDQWDVTAITDTIPSSGIHHLKLKLVKSDFGTIVFGVCPSTIDQSQEKNFKQCGWYYSCLSGGLFSGPPHDAFDRSYHSMSRRSIRFTGREVGVTIDMTTGQISFTLDGENKGTAYKDIPVNQHLCFCVMLCELNDIVRILL